MSSNPQQLANINSLRSYIDSTNDVSIRQKSDLIKDLNNKKEEMIDKINNVLSSCRNKEAMLYDRWINTDNKEAHTKLEEYNKYLKDQHDKGSDIIGQINASKNFQQLRQVELTLVDSFLAAVKTTCDNYTNHEILNQPAVSQTGSVTTIATPLIKSSSSEMNRSVSTIQTIPTAGTNNTYITGPSSPAPVRTSSSSVVHHIYTPPASSPPTRVVTVPSPPQTVVVHQAPSPPPRTVVMRQAPSPTVVRTVRSTPVQTVPVRTVQVQPVRTAQVQPVRSTPVQPVAVVQTPRPASPRAGRAVMVTSPTPRRTGIYDARVVQDYTSGAPGTLTLKKDTVVRVINYYGDWARVETRDGHNGYVSRFFLRPMV
jgi:hypothetical protein